MSVIVTDSVSHLSLDTGSGTGDWVVYFFTIHPSFDLTSDLSTLL